ncbi:MAG: DUF4339 domain-containing protein [Acidobacteria bacterium]|nr:DUF4339 domain-containing protein [Acidobacteriota bacterium]MCW5949874.1 DUF4339 domain-containing protein [Pyrinomonadaceae bacterium]
MYYIQKLGIDNPLDQAQLEEALKTGVVMPTDLACVPGMSEWKDLEDLAECPPVCKIISKFFDDVADLQLLWRYHQKYPENQFFGHRILDIGSVVRGKFDEHHDELGRHPLALQAFALACFYHGDVRMSEDAFRSYDDEENWDEIDTLQRTNAKYCISMFEIAANMFDEPEFQLRKVMPLLLLGQHDQALKAVEAAEQLNNGDPAIAERCRIAREQVIELM